METFFYVPETKLDHHKTNTRNSNYKMKKRFRVTTPLVLLLATSFVSPFFGTTTSAVAAAIDVPSATVAAATIGVSSAFALLPPPPTATPSRGEDGTSSLRRSHFCIRRMRSPSVNNVSCRTSNSDSGETTTNVPHSSSAVVVPGKSDAVSTLTTKMTRRNFALLGRQLALPTVIVVAAMIPTQPASALQERNEALCNTGFFTNVGAWYCTDIGNIGDEGKPQPMSGGEEASIDSLMGKFGSLDAFSEDGSGGKRDGNGKGKATTSNSSSANTGASTTKK